MIVINKDLRDEYGGSVKMAVFLCNSVGWSRRAPVNMFKNISSSSTMSYYYHPSETLSH